MDRLVSSEEIFSQPFMQADSRQKSPESEEDALISCIIEVEDWRVAQRESRGPGSSTDEGGVKFCRLWLLPTRRSILSSLSRPSSQHHEQVVSGLLLCLITDSPSFGGTWYPGGYISTGPRDVCFPSTPLTRILPSTPQLLPDLPPKPLHHTRPSYFRNDKRHGCRATLQWC